MGKFMDDPWKWLGGCATTAVIVIFVMCGFICIAVLLVKWLGR
jgi:hypothetical protein